MRAILQLNQNILGKYGWYRSFRQGRPINASGEPIPWFTYPAIDYLMSFDLSQRSVFEWGAGYSTLFWCKRAKRVVSIETDTAWHLEISKLVAPSCTIHLLPPDISVYCGFVDQYDCFDIIVVDGPGETRFGCCRKAVNHISADGLIILDNSDSWPQCAAFLRTCNLIQVDFTGFAPLSVNAHTTSIFLTRKFSFSASDGLQPRRSPAQPAESWKDVFDPGEEMTSWERSRSLFE